MINWQKTREMNTFKIHDNFFFKCKFITVEGEFQTTEETSRVNSLEFVVSMENHS